MLEASEQRRGSRTGNSLYWRSKEVKKFSLHFK